MNSGITVPSLSGFTWHNIKIALQKEWAVISTDVNF